MIIPIIPVAVTASDATVKVALIVASSALFSSFLGPIVLGGLTDRRNQRNRKEDFARQDAVAARAEATAVHLLEQQATFALAATSQAKEAARLLVTSNNNVSDTAKVQIAKLDQIHTLVNSALTAAIENELAVHKPYLVLLERSLLMLGTDHDRVVGFIQATKERIKALEAQLWERKEQTDKAAQQLEVDLKKEK